MATTEPYLEEQFDTLEQQYEASNLGMWIFLGTEVMFFGGLFLGYSVYRGAFTDAFREGSQHLDLVLGTINTGILLFSSLTMALAVHRSQIGNRKQLTLFLLATLVLGSTFVGIKFYEYFHKWEQNLIPNIHFHLPHTEIPGVDPDNVQLFYSFYFTMTGLHALHMIIGLAIVAIIAWRAWKGHFPPENYTPIEITGLYWHFVDVIWVFLFPLLYLI